MCRPYREMLNQSIFIVADFGRLSKNVSRLEKDVVAPYLHVVPSYTNDRSDDPFASRETFLFFRGRVHRKAVSPWFSWVLHPELYCNQQHSRIGWLMIPVYLLPVGVLLLFVQDGHVRGQLAELLVNISDVRFEDSLDVSEEGISTVPFFLSLSSTAYVSVFLLTHAARLWEPLNWKRVLHFLLKYLVVVAGDWRHAKLTLLPESGWRYTVELPTVRYHCQSLCPCHNKWQNWAAFRRRPWLQRVCALFLGRRGYSARVLGGGIEEYHEREVVANVGEVEGRCPSFWVSASCKARRCCEYGLQTGAKESVGGQTLNSPVSKTQSCRLVEKMRLPAELPSGRSFSVNQSDEVLSAAPFVHAFYMMASWKVHL